MSKSKDILVKMIEYIDHAKKVLQEEGYLQPTVFAHTRMHDSVIVLPVVSENNDLPDLALDLIGKVLRAYNVSDYFVVSESYHLLSVDAEESQECINVIYVGIQEKKLISVSFSRLSTGEFFFGDTVEILPTNIEGSVLELFQLKDRTPRISEKEKAHIRILFPTQSEDEMASSPNQTLH